MTLLLTFVLLCLVLENDDLLRLVLLNDRCGYFRIRYVSTRLNTVFVGNHKHFERNRIAFVRREFFYAY